ncbi:hypothetical LCDV1 paralog family 2 [Lymphocystis disease virus 1]|uniref:hypothetical LCDV1 paralog family 2 n=1 Tax=Fish lymphocystis disease virus TaxID=36363 RepID=UPI0000161EBA|nr:hypothetical LCDV1 paralog family 2 [Lymphocystis disease virus 1]
MFDIKTGGILIVPNPYLLNFNIISNQKVLLLTEIKSLDYWKVTLLQRPNICIKSYRCNKLDTEWDVIIFDHCEKKIFVINRYKKLLTCNSPWFIFRNVIFKSYDRIITNFLPENHPKIQFDPDLLNLNICYLEPMFSEEELYLIKWVTYALAYKNKVATKKIYNLIADLHLDPVLILTKLLVECSLNKRHSRYTAIIQFLGTGKWMNNNPIIAKLKFHVISYDLSTRIKALKDVILSYKAIHEHKKCCVMTHTKLLQKYLTLKLQGLIDVKLSADLLIEPFAYDTVFSPQKRLFNRFELGIGLHSIIKPVEFIFFHDTKLEQLLRPCILYNSYELVYFLTTNL